VTKNLASATLEPYQDYADSNGAFRVDTTFVPDHPARRSDLEFICAPSAGSGGLLTSTGRTTTGSGVFFVAPQGYTQAYAHTGMGTCSRHGTSSNWRQRCHSRLHCGRHPTLRWRLKQVVQPTESLQIFALATSSAWINEIMPAGTTTLSDNMVTLIVLPERAAGDSGPALATDFPL